MNEAWIVGGCRTPMGRYLGSLSSEPATRLGATVIRSLRIQPDLAELEIDQVLMGQVVGAGAGQAPARQAALLGGLPDSVGATTVNKVCGSGLVTAMMADMAIRSGEMECLIAGGMESMSNGPHLLYGARSGWKYGARTLVDSVDFDGLHCSMGNSGMGLYADQTAKQWCVSRADQDAWALRSHLRAIQADQRSDFVREITPVAVTKGRETEQVSHDETPRAECTLEALLKLRPAFSDDGTVTAGNASPLSDGAAAVMVVSNEIGKAMPGDFKFRIVAQAAHAEKPSDIFIAPVGAIRKILKKTNRTVGDIDLFELNEAFAAQTIACQRLLEIDEEKLNVSGGAIALGHPLGCSGARILVTLMHTLMRMGKQTGIAALCLGGGEAVAMLIERVE